MVDGFPEEGEDERHKRGQEASAQEDDDGLPHLHRGLDARGHRHVTGSIPQSPTHACVEQHGSGSQRLQFKILDRQEYYLQFFVSMKKASRVKFDRCFLFVLVLPI